MLGFIGLAEILTKVGYTVQPYLIAGFKGFRFMFVNGIEVEIPWPPMIERTLGFNDTSTLGIDTK